MVSLWVLEPILSKTLRIVRKSLKLATYDIRQTSIKTSFASVISTLLNNAPLSAHSQFAHDPDLSVLNPRVLIVRRCRCEIMHRF